MAKKKGKSQSSTPKDEGPRLVESDSPNGPWTRVPDSAVKKKVLSPDTDEMAEARLQNRALNWLVPVDLLTELYDSMLGCHTRLWSQQLEILRRKFGPAFTLDDIRLWLFARGQKMDGLGWPIIVKLVETEPPAKDAGEQGKPGAKLPKRPKGELDKQVGGLLKSGEKTAGQIMRILNMNYASIYRPTSRKAIEGTVPWKKIHKKKAR